MLEMGSWITAPVNLLAEPKRRAGATAQTCGSVSITCFDVTYAAMMEMARAIAQLAGEVHQTSHTMSLSS
jgi:hypothetical protein